MINHDVPAWLRILVVAEGKNLTAIAKETGKKTPLVAR